MGPCSHMGLHPDTCSLSVLIRPALVPSFCKALLPGRDRAACCFVRAEAGRKAKLHKGLKLIASFFFLAYVSLFCPCRLIGWWNCILSTWMQCRQLIRRLMGRNTYVLLKFCQVMSVTPLHSHVICTGLLAQPVIILRRALIPVLLPLNSYCLTLQVPGNLR